MKKILVFLLSSMISLAIAQSASAYPVQEGDDLNLISYNTTTSAGAFNFSIERNGTILEDTIWTFCLEPTVYINLSDDYRVTDLKEGSGIATADSSAWNEMAWLYWNYDQGTLNKAIANDNGWSGLQYAFWMLVGQGNHVPYYNNYGANTYLNWAKTAVADGWTNDGRVIVAVNPGQDILVANPVPEPATMLLLGAGLVGLAGFRRKFKKS